MRKRITVLLTAVFCILLLIPTTAFAANRVPEIEIKVALRPDGSAHITQIWTTNTEEGTEFYLARKDSGYLSITEFSVSDKNGPYTFVENWDVDASFEEKAGKCGIVETYEGVELCWGISEYGENRYVMEYVLHDLVGSYWDADGFNHCFVDEMSFFPSNVTLTIRNEDGTPLVDETCDIWGFGYDGQIVFEEGVIRAWSESPMKSGQYMTIMVSLQKGMLSPLRVVDDSFETVKERALDDSDYGETEEENYEDYGDPTFWDYILVFGIYFSPVFLIIWLVKLRKKSKQRKIRKRMEQAGYFRDAPNDGNLNVTYHLGICSGLCEEDALLGAYLMRLIMQGCLESTDDSLDVKSVRLRVCHGPQSGNEYDDALYTILEAAAGEDGILDPNEMSRYCNQNYIPLFRFADSCEHDAMQKLRKEGCLKIAPPQTVKDLTEKGVQELDEIYGLKHFLLDFSLIQERSIKETVIWQDYMVYALMLGIADKVEEQIRDLYPDQLPQLERYQRYTRYTRHYNSYLYGAYSCARLQRTPKSSRSSGGGGRASSRGGRGSSGGGRGGTR